MECAPSVALPLWKEKAWAEDAYRTECFAAFDATRHTAVRQGTRTDRPEVPSGLLPAQGVLPDSIWRAAIEHGWVTADDGKVPIESIQPASLDLRLGPIAHRLRSSFLPGQKSVASCLGDYQLGAPISLAQGAVLEQNRPYLIPLLEKLKLPVGIRARANPKSSIGRLDVFTRLVVDESPGFDDIPTGYCGPIYLEVVSRSFTIQVTEGLPFNQIRLVHGDADFRVPDEELQRAHARRPLLFQSNYDGEQPNPVTEPIISHGLFLTVDLLGDADKVVGYRAKKNSMLLDVSKESGYRAEDFWEQVRSDQQNRLILEPEEFYLLVSLEKVSVPQEWAGEMTAYDPTSGELRTHYAGFFDPGFGFSQSDGVYGSRAVLEVRAHDVPFCLQHKQRIARLVFEHMARPPDRLYGPDIGSSYQNQRLKLSKIFRDWPPKTAHQMSFLPG